MGNIQFTMESAGALCLLLSGLAMIGCGVNVCWLKFRRRGTELAQKRAPRSW